LTRGGGTTGKPTPGLVKSRGSVSAHVETSQAGSAQRLAQLWKYKAENNINFCKTVVRRQEEGGRYFTPAETLREGRCSRNVFLADVLNTRRISSVFVVKGLCNLDFQENQETKQRKNSECKWHGANIGIAWLSGGDKLRGSNMVTSLRIAFVFCFICVFHVHGQQEGSVRLRGGDRPTNGRVEIFHNNTWGTICDDGWGTQEARVVCRQLGHAGHEYQARGRAYYGAGQGTIQLDDMSCLGTESTLSQCSHRAWGTSNCNHNEDAGVDCDVGTAGTADPIRLVGGTNNYEGRVEIQHGGNWGTICDDHWDDKAAQVACKQLGLTGTIGIPLTSAYFSNGTGNTGLSILLDDVACTGTESGISACNHKPWGSNNCQHREDAGLICLRPPPSGVNMQVRLAGGLNNGTVISASRYRGGRGPIWLDDVRCAGTEPSLVNCTIKPWGVNDCSHAEDVAVACTQPANADHIVATLDGGGTRGRLLATVNGQQGTVCDDYATNGIAMVVCRELGFNTTNPIVTKVPSSAGPTSLPIVMDHVRCVGTESSLAGCRYSKTNNCNHREDLGVDCQVGELLVLLSRKKHAEA
ncbi:hypothetical protein BaRGS_00040422, partial [Batillaria attramentaria]